MKMLTKVQLFVHLKCVEDTILRLSAGVYNYSSKKCSFCNEFGDSCKKCTWHIIQHRSCVDAYKKWHYVWKAYRFVTLHWWQYKIKRRLHELES